MSTKPKTESAQRLARGVVSGTHQHFSRAVRAGDLLFLAGNGFDGDGVGLPGAIPDPPYHLSEAARGVYQTRALYDQYRSALEEFGCTFADVVQIEQYIPHKIYGDSYVNTSRGAGYLERMRPTSALLVTGDLAPAGAVIAHSAIVAVPSEDVQKEIVRADDEFTKHTVNADYGDSWAEEPPFHEVVTAGPHLYTVGDMALDWDRGEIPAGVKVQPFTYWGSEIRNETEFLLARLREFVSRVGGSLDDITHVSVYLTEIGDLFEMDRVWHKFFGDNPPARTVVPVRAHGSPRHEAPGLTHADEAVRLEHITQGIVPGRGVEREIVETPFQPIGHESVAVRAGEFVWISQQYACTDDTNSQVSGSTADQLEVIAERLRTICVAAGTELGQTVRLRAYFADPAENTALTALLRRIFPADPPTVLTSGVGGELLIPGATVVVDAIVYAPR